MQSPHPHPADTSSLRLAVALRKATAQSHEAVERLPIMVRLTSRAVTRDDYRLYLQAIADVYRILEPRLYDGLDAVRLRERLGVRPKLPALLHDLEELGRADMTDERDVPDRFDPRGASAVVGGLYVLEGATLGGRTIARHLRRQLGDELGAASFLDFHGALSSASWKRFSGTLDELRAERILEPDETIAGALAAFAAVHRCLSRA